MGGGSVPGGSEIWLWFGRDIQLAMVAGALFSTPVAAWAAHRLNGTKVGTVVYRWARWIAVVALFLACLPLLVADTYNPFIYFRF